MNGVTHYYYYDGINLVKEEWGDNILVFFYDVNGSPVGMQYRDLSDDEGSWDTYLYEKNLQGDIVAVYNTSGTKLVSYRYDAWGRILGTTYHNSGASTSAVHNPFRYRGYYYDTDLNLYYLATRYYDPEVRRFVTADDPAYLGANGDLVSYNLFAYCSNNPVMYVDPTGHVIVAAIIGFALIGASLAFAATAYYDYADDGEVFNGSIDAGSYVANTLVGGAIGGGAAYLAPEIGAFLTSSFSYTMPSLAAGGEAVAATISGAQIAAGVAAGVGIMLFAKDPYVKHLEKGMSQNQKEHFQREIEAFKKAEGRGGKDNIDKDILEEIAEMIKEMFK